MGERPGAGGEDGLVRGPKLGDECRPVTAPEEPHARESGRFPAQARSRRRSGRGPRLTAPKRPQ